MEILSIYIFMLIYRTAATPFPENALIASDSNRDFHTPIDLLWNDLTGPVETDIEQNGLGDCWMLATLASIVDSSGGQDLIKTIIKNNTDKNKADILLYNSDGKDQKSYTVSKPSLADLQNGFLSNAGGFSISGGTGMSEAHSWVACMEKAMEMAGYRTEVESGGWAYYAMKRIYGGDNGQWIDISSLSDDNLWTRILAAPGVPAVAASNDHAAKGIVSQHSYSLLGSTTGDKTSQIVLRNPWGEINTNSWGIPNNPGKFPDLGNGKFSMSLDTFRNSFDTIYYLH